MAKKKEDLGGVWRTVGGRRIFIKDGQDLYEAMNDSGKFTNLKKTNSQRKKEYRIVNGNKVLATFNEDQYEEGYKKMREMGKELKAKGEEDNLLYKEYKAQGVKEVDYIGQDGKLHKMNSYEYPEDRDGYHKYLTEKYGTYKEEEIKDKNGRTDYKKLREEFYDSQKEFKKWKEENNEKIASYYSTTYSKDLENINKDVWNSIAKDIYDEEKMPEKINKQTNASKIDNFVKNNPDWEIGRYDEEEYDDLADTLGVGRNNVAEEIYDRIREKNISDHKEMFERVKKDFIEKTDKREKESKEKYEYELYKKARQDENSIDPMTENSTDWEELDRKYKDRYEKELSEAKKYQENKISTTKQKEFPLLKKHGLDKDEKFRYMMLSRMQSDADYYLGNGNKNAKNLWAKDEEEHIGLMKELYDSVSEKPDWLSKEQLNKYEKELSYEKYKRNSIETNKNDAQRMLDLTKEYNVRTFADDIKENEEIKNSVNFNKEMITGNERSVRQLEESMEKRKRDGKGFEYQNLKTQKHEIELETQKLRDQINSRVEQYAKINGISKEEARRLLGL